MYKRRRARSRPIGGKGERADDECVFHEICAGHAFRIAGEAKTATVFERIVD